MAAGSESGLVRVLLFVMGAMLAVSGVLFRSFWLSEWGPYAFTFLVWLTMSVVLGWGGKGKPYSISFGLICGSGIALDLLATLYTNVYGAMTPTRVGSQIRGILTHCAKRRFGMTKAISLRVDYDGTALRRLAKKAKDAAQVRRLLALASIYDGRSRQYASEIGGVTVQIVRDWVLRFNERGRPAGLINTKAPGGRAKLNDAQRQALAKIVERGPIPAVHGVVRWRRKDLVQWLFQEFRVSVDETTVGRELKTLGFAKLSARPRHYAQNELEGEVFKKTSPPRWQRSGRNARPARTSKFGGPTKPE